MRRKDKLDRSSFQKLAKELYRANPDTWNNILTKSGKTVYSQGKDNNKKQTRQVFNSKAYGNLMKKYYDTFQKFGSKKDQHVQKPKSIRINNETITQNRAKNQRNTNAETSYVDSSAVESFRYDPAKKNLTIQFTSGPKEYLYPEVPQNVVNGLYAAPSKGIYVDRVISQYSNIKHPEVQKKIRQGD